MKWIIDVRKIWRKVYFSLSLSKIIIFGKEFNLIVFVFLLCVFYCFWSCNRDFGYKFGKLVLLLVCSIKFLLF